MKLDISTDLRGMCQININDVDEADKPRVEKFLELVVNYLNAQIDNDTSEEKKADLEVPVPTKANGQAFYEYTLSVSNLDEAELTLANGKSIKEAYEAILEYPVPSNQSEETKGQLYVHLNTYFDLDPQTTSVDQVYSVFFVRDVANVGQILEGFTAPNTKDVPRPPSNPPKAPLVRSVQNSEEKVIINFQAASEKFMISIDEAIMYFTDPDSIVPLLIMCDTPATKGDENELVFSYIGDDKNSETALNAIKKLTTNEVQAAVANIRNKQNKATGRTDLKEKPETVKQQVTGNTNETFIKNSNTTTQPIASKAKGIYDEDKITIDLNEAAKRFSITVGDAKTFFKLKYASLFHDSSESVTRDQDNTTIDLLFDASTLDLETTLNEINALTQDNYREYILAELDEVNEDALEGDDVPTTVETIQPKISEEAQSMNRHDPRLPLAGNLTDAAPHHPPMSVVAAISPSNHNPQERQGDQNLHRNSWKEAVRGAHERAAEHKLADATYEFFSKLDKNLNITTYLEDKGELTVKQNAETILHMAPPDKSGNVKTEHNGSPIAWRGVFEGMVAAKHTTCAFTLSDANPETNQQSAKGFVDTLNELVRNEHKFDSINAIVFTFQDNNTKDLVTQALQEHGETATLALFGLEKVGAEVLPTAASTHTDAQKHNTAQISGAALAAPAEAAGDKTQEPSALADSEADLIKKELEGTTVDPANTTNAGPMAKPKPPH